MLVLDAQARVLSADSAFLKLWGYAHLQELVGMDFASLCQPGQDALGIVQETVKHMSWRGTIKAKAATGGLFEVTAAGICAPAEPGASPRVALSLMQRPTPVFDARVERSDQPEIFQAVFINYPDPIYVMDHEGWIIATNPAAAAIHQSEQGGLAGRNIAELGDPGNASKAAGRVGRAAAGETLRFDSGQTLPDGSVLPLEVLLTPFDCCGETLVLGICRDISTRQTAEKLIRESAERPRLALASANQGLYDLNVQTGECVVNDEYATMLGYDPETFVETNQAWIERLHPDDREPVAQKYRDYVSGKIKDYRVEFRQRMTNGRWKWILSIGKIIEFDDQGQPLRFVGTHTDISDMKAAQEIIRQDAERSQLALASTNQGFFEANLHTGEVQVSKEYASMLGYEPHEMRDNKTAFLNHLHPDEIDGAEQEMRDYLEGRIKSFQHEGRMKTRDGQWKWILGVTSVIEYDEHGKPLRLTGTHTDITEIKKAQQNQHEIALRERITLANTRQGFYEANLQTGETYVSSEYAQMYGFEPEELGDIQTAWLDRLHPAHHESAYEMQTKICSGQINYDQDEFRMRRRDGREIWVIASASVIEYDDKGMPLRITGTHTDITDLKTAQLAEQEKNARTRLAMASTNHGFFDCNLQTGETYVNDEFAHMLGFEPDEMRDINSAWADRLHPDDTEAAHSRADDFISGHIDTYRSEFQMSTKDGQWKWILSTATILERDADGNALRMVGMHTDISEMKAEQEVIEKRQQQLIQSGRITLANGLASALAHELNQPLCAMVNHLGALKHTIDALGIDDQAVAQDTQLACDAAHRAAHVMKRFRQLFAEQQPQRKACDLHELIKDSLELITPALKQDRVTVEIDCAPDIPAIKADPTLIQQVLLNLTQNAIQAMQAVPEDRRALRFSVLPGPKPDWLVLRVKDTGTGFSDKMIENLFEINDNPGSQGLGLGLCICRLIVKAHSGEIWLEKTGSEGSTISIRLPTGLDDEHD